MAVTAIIAIIMLIRHTKAGPIVPVQHERPCVEFGFPIHATAQNAEYDIINVKNDINATALAIDFDTWSSPTSEQRLLKNITVSDTFNINVQLCVPPEGSKKDHLQIATHGFGFDKRYWDAAINPSEYSYVDAALEAGYSILTYDRLGTGRSDKPDANTIVQAPLELEILRGITESARQGSLLQHAISADKANTLPTISNNPAADFTKFIHVGHSYGSFLTSALLTSYGNLSDAAIITGFFLNPHFADLRWTAADLSYAPHNNATLFHDRSAGYLVGGTRKACQTTFFSTRANATTKTGGFDPEVLDYAFSIRQTMTGAEIQSTHQVDLGVAKDFKGPVQVVVAEFDFAACRGDCKGLLDLKMIKELYPKATAVDSYVQYGSGHGLTLHRGARVGFKASLDWLEGNGL